MRVLKERGMSGSSDKGLVAEAQEGCSDSLGLDRKVEKEAEIGQGLMIQKGKDEEHQGLEQ